MSAKEVNIQLTACRLVKPEIVNRFRQLDLMTLKLLPWTKPAYLRGSKSKKWNIKLSMGSRRSNRLRSSSWKVSIEPRDWVKASLRVSSQSLLKKAIVLSRRFVLLPVILSQEGKWVTWKTMGEIYLVKLIKIRGLRHSGLITMLIMIKETPLSKRVWNTPSMTAHTRTSKR